MSTVSVQKSCQVISRMITDHRSRYSQSKLIVYTERQLAELAARPSPVDLLPELAAGIRQHILVEVAMFDGGLTYESAYWKAREEVTRLAQSGGLL